MSPPVQLPFGGLIRSVARHHSPAELPPAPFGARFPGSYPIRHTFVDSINAAYKAEFELMA
jgi:hypothetical protein